MLFRSHFPYRLRLLLLLLLVVVAVAVVVVVVVAVVVVVVIVVLHLHLSLLHHFNNFLFDLFSCHKILKFLFFSSSQIIYCAYFFFNNPFFCASSLIQSDKLKLAAYIFIPSNFLMADILIILKLFVYLYY